MQASWDSVASNPDYMALPPDQQAAARSQYFQQVVAPNVPPDQLTAAQQQFDAYSGGKASLSPFSGIAALANNALETASQTGDIAQTALSNIGSAETRPLDVSNPIATIGDIGSRAAGITGNMLRAATSPIEATLRTNVFQPGGMISRNVLPAIVNKQFEGANIPQADLDNVAQSPQIQKAFQDTAANSTTQAGMIASAPRQMNIADQLLSNKEGWQSVLAPTVAKPQSINADMFNAAADNAYKAVENGNTVLAPSVTEKTLSILDSAKQKPIAGKVLTSENADINKALSEYDELSGSPLTISDWQQIDSTLGDKAAQAYVSGNRNKGRIISEAQDKIRDLVKPGNLTANDVSGSTEGIDALTQHAIPLWATKYRIADIQKIIDRANAMDNPSSAMRTGFRNLMLNKNRMSVYPKEVQALIIKAAKTGVVDDTLGIVGSRLNGIIGGAVGGPKGAIVANTTAMAGRGIRNAMKNNQADKIVNSLLEGVRPSIEKYHNYTGQP